MATYIRILGIYVTCAQAYGWQFEMTKWLTDLRQGHKLKVTLFCPNYHVKVIN